MLGKLNDEQKIGISLNYNFMKEIYFLMLQSFIFIIKRRTTLNTRYVTKDIYIFSV
jgi:hypothetical protein